MADAIDKAKQYPVLAELVDIINGQAVGLKALQDTLATITGVTLPGLGTKFLRKDAADATPYTLAIAPSQSMTDAVQKSELVGGLLRPYRLFSPVGATAVGATVRTGQAAAITDALGLGMVYKITKIQVQTISAPTLVSTITIKNGSTTIFTQNVALASVPAVGKTLDLLTLASAMPGNLTLPATLTCTASAGTFEILIDGVLV